ncbi:hypothetical protein EDB87DRAFT_178801 [Lactarius vividus]|nr:hypothetical protein EDB87DRAFT_178801 [Lactarius vividus]
MSPKAEEARKKERKKKKKKSMLVTKNELSITRCRCLDRRYRFATCSERKELPVRDSAYFSSASKASPAQLTLVTLALSSPYLLSTRLSHSFYSHAIATVRRGDPSTKYYIFQFECVTRPLYFYCTSPHIALSYSLSPIVLFGHAGASFLWSFVPSIAERSNEV